MDLKTISEQYNIPYHKVRKIKKNLRIRFLKNKLSYEQMNLIVSEYAKEFEISLNTKLLIYEYKERWPFLDEKDIAYSFCLDLKKVEKIFKYEYLIIPSKLNN